MNAFGSRGDLGELVGRLRSHVTVGDMFLVQSIVTCGALFWLLYRASQTLWKPVPELISILGVEVPEPPEVSLAGIKSDAVTLHWTKLGANKPVLKYLIQVNGVNVGESARHETAITVTGLKAGHFYNVRVIAVGNNNFQAGSQVIRLRTYGKDGRPGLGNGRMPTSSSTEELQSGTLLDSSDESSGTRSHRIGIESASKETEGAAGREINPALVAHRRNTGGRRHSPSTASEQFGPVGVVGASEETMHQLTERFEHIRAETEDTIAQVSRDAEDFKTQMAELLKERDDKRQILKEREEVSERLKKEVNISERANRQAQNRKGTKEKALRDKETERTKMHDDVARWKREIQSMREERDAWHEARQDIHTSTEKQMGEMRGILHKRQLSLNGLEEEIRVRGLQIKELEEERQNLPGGEVDEEAREQDAIERQKDLHWDQRERELMARFNGQTMQFRTCEDQLQRAHAYHATLAARQPSNSLMFQSNSSGVDFDIGGQNRLKPRRSRNRRSRTSTISSPVTTHAVTDSTVSNMNGYNGMTSIGSPSFAPGPYMDLSTASGAPQSSEGMTEADIKALTAGAPLSPSATSLLPSALFADDEPGSPQVISTRMFSPPPFEGLGPSITDTEEASPYSSSRSTSFISSPRHSTQSLHNNGDSVTDGRLLNISRAPPGLSGSTVSGDDPVHEQRSFANLFSFPRQKNKATPEEGPAFGSLKLGQSHSFPRQTEDIESLKDRARKTSFSSGWAGLSFLNRGGNGVDLTEGNGPAPARNVARKRRALGVFGSSIDDPLAVYPDRNPGSPRPASIASSDLPRPSTDSAPFGWTVPDGNGLSRNSPLAANWSVNVSGPWSRNPSRRPSVQHASTSNLTSGIVADDDEFLPPETLLNQSSPPPVGVIGTRPQSAKSATPKLNPAAPTFKAMFGRGKTDKSDKKLKRSSSEGNEDHAQSSIDETSSPSDSRKSRDTRSVHTQISVSDSHDSLDRITSSTTSDLATPSNASHKDGKENSFQKLLRKGSSSKFSIGSFRSKDSSLFSKAKNTTTPDRNASGERASSFGDMEESAEDMLGRSVDSLNHSAITGSSREGTPREGRMSVNWGRFGLKKAKDKRRESEEIGDRRASETEGLTEDESHW